MHRSEVERGYAASNLNNIIETIDFIASKSIPLATNIPTPNVMRYRSCADPLLQPFPGLKKRDGRRFQGHLTEAYIRVRAARIFSCCVTGERCGTRCTTLNAQASNRGMTRPQNRCR